MAQRSCTLQRTVQMSGSLEMSATKNFDYLKNAYQNGNWTNECSRNKNCHVRIYLHIVVTVTQISSLLTVCRINKLKLGIFHKVNINYIKEYFLC